MNLEKVHNIFFIGVGGIGMSALARYFIFSGKRVAGYDLTPSPLTSKLIDEGVKIHFKDSIELIPDYIKDDAESLIIYTPAIPENNEELNYFFNSGHTILKRSKILGEITNSYNTIAVAGTHGKTSISGILSHLITESSSSCTAFLGGISKNFNSNFIYAENAEFGVAEADEFDRSFLNLDPAHAIITSTDADHLDIYSNHDSLRNSFSEFAMKVKKGGFLLHKAGIFLNTDEIESKSIYTYSVEQDSDFTAFNIRLVNGNSFFDISLPNDEIIKDFRISLPGRINIENSLAAASMAWLVGIDKDEIKKALANFEGMVRRFDFRIESKELIYMDDYAHHPQEILAMLTSVKEMYPGRKLTGVFQPHLFSRTKDFAEDFGKSLSLLDEVILLDIYPAREEPIVGVTSKIILDNIAIDKKSIISKEDFINSLENKDLDFLITIGAGDIDRLVPRIQEILEKRIK